MKKKKNVFVVLSALILLLIISSAVIAAVIVLNNEGFELGDFTDWDVTIPPGGTADVTTSGQGKTANDGSYFALLKTDGPGSYTTVSQAITAQAGDTISGAAFFQAGDYLPYDDNAYVRILSEDGSEVVAELFFNSVLCVGDFGSTPWTGWEYTFVTSGNYILEARVSNYLDSVLDSYMGLDSGFAPSNGAPVVSAGGPYYVAPDSTTPLADATAVDPDNDPMTYYWTVTNSGGAYCSVYPVTSLNPNMSCSGNGSSTLNLFVSDGFNCVLANTAVNVNNDIAPQLTVIKNVVNDNGGTAVASDFNMFVAGTNVSTPNFPGDTTGTTVTLDAGSYNVDESSPPAYTPSYSADCAGSIAIGQHKTCTVTNDDVAPQLTVIKNLVDFGGPHTPSDFTMHVNGTDVSPNAFPGNSSGTAVTLNPGSYNVIESGPAGYTATYSQECNGSIDIGQQKSCTITNTAEPASIKVNKDVEPSEVWEPGGDVEFIIDVWNNGPIRPIIVTDIDDSYFGNLNSECDLPVEVPAGQTFTCRFTEYISGGGGDLHYNQVLVTAEDKEGNVLTDTSDEDVHILDIPSSIKVEKDAAKSEVLEPGEDLTFTITVKNTSLVDEVTIETVSDNVYGDLTAECLPTGPETLQVGETFTCDFTRYVGGQTGDIHNNTVTVSGTDDDGQAVSDSDSEQVQIDNVASSIKVDLRAGPDQVYEPGDDVTFTVDIHNSSTADSVTIDQIKDNTFGDVTAECLAGTAVTLNPGSTYNCTFSRYIGGQMDDLHSSQVTVLGTDDDGHAVSDTAGDSVLVLDTPSSLLVTQTVNPQQVTAPGGDVAFTVTILNDSVADEVTVNSLDDTVYLGIAANCAPALPATIKPGESITCSMTTYIGGQSGDVFSSRATASGEDDDGYPVGDWSEVSIHIVQAPYYTIFFPSIRGFR